MTGWWQKPIWRQTWDMARVGSLLMLVPLAVAVGVQRWHRTVERAQYSGCAIQTVAITSNQQRIIGVGQDHRPQQHRNFLAAWNLRTGRKQWEVAVPGLLNEIATSPNQKYLLSRVVDKTGQRAEVRDTATGNVLREVSVPSEASGAEWIGQGQTLAVPESGALALHFLSERADKVVRIVLPGTAPIAQIENLDARKFLTVVSGTTGTPGAVQVRSVATGQVVRTLEQGQGLTASVLPGGGQVVVRNAARKRVTLYDVATGEEVVTARFNKRTESRFRVVSSSVADCLDFVCWEPFVMVADEVKPRGTRLHRYRWYIKTGVIRPVTVLPPPDGAITPSPDGRLLVSLHSGDGNRHPAIGSVCDALSGEVLCQLDGTAGW